MRIAVDANMPLAEEYFAPYGSVWRFEGRRVSREDLLESDVLLVRSVTKVNKSLLDGTSVRIVGTATAGINHLDVPYLESTGRLWSSAPGCNAPSVADWVCSALSSFVLDGRLQPGSRVGVLGHGHVGRRVRKALLALGFNVVVYDPLRKPLFPEEDLAELEELYDCKVLTAHIPLTTTGDFPTSKWLDDVFLRQFAPGLIFLNAARGEVMRQEDVLRLRRDGHLSALALDVFDDEPNVGLDVLDTCDLCTPHIAGYSWGGKARGTYILAQKLAEWLACPEPVILPPAPAPVLDASHGNIWELCLEAYPIQADSAHFRQEAAKAGGSAPIFDKLRKSYPNRPEFSDCKVTQVPEALEGAVRGLQFQRA